MQEDMYCIAFYLACFLMILAAHFIGVYALRLSPDGEEPEKLQSKILILADALRLSAVLLVTITALISKR